MERQRLIGKSSWLRKALRKELLLETDPGLAKGVMSLEHVLAELLVKGWIWVIGTMSVGSNSSEHS